LGYTWDKYREYCQQVRKEYAIYPDFLYNPGRKKALQHFLDMDVIFKTGFFRNKYEIQARKNIVQEISGLV
jgi:predicted metal-dependent HD superfamily phosphohydrolase